MLEWDGAAVVVSRDGDQIRKLTVDNRREVKVEPQSERGWMEEEGKKGLITRQAARGDLEEVCSFILMGFANQVRKFHHDCTP